MINRFLKSIFILLIIVLPFKIVSAQSTEASFNAPDRQLYDAIAFQDSVLFSAFNSRNLDRLKSFFAENLEVYQDNIGVRSYSETVEAFKGLFEADYVLNRQLVIGSLEVYPIKDFGAIETGRHTFCHVENGEQICGTFKFVHIWVMQNGQWKITRIITYDHKN